MSFSSLDDKGELYRTYGVAHFSAKYGLSPGHASSVSVPAGKMLNCVASWRDTEYGRLPFFEDLADKELIEHNGEGLQVNYDIWGAIGYALSGGLENLSLEEKKKAAHIPFVDIYEQMLFDALRDAERKQGRGLESKPFWPENRKFAVLLTHDIDEIRKTYQYFTRSAIHLKKGELGRSFHHMNSFLSDKAFRRNPYWTFENMLSIEKEYNVKSSSYFLQETGPVLLHKPGTFKLYARKYRFDNPKVAGMMKAMHAGGWEVGLHGSYYSYLSEEKLRSEKNDLESSLGQAVTGTRQHHLNLKFPETWEYHEKAGLEYDTSLGFKDKNGYRWGTCFPFHPLSMNSCSEMSLLEMPLTIMDTTFFTREKEADQEIASLVSTVEKQGGLLTVLFHHSVFNDQEYPGWIRRYRALIEMCQKKGAWIATGQEINNWWRAR